MGFIFFIIIMGLFGFLIAALRKCTTRFEKVLINLLNKSKGKRMSFCLNIIACIIMALILMALGVLILFGSWQTASWLSTLFAKASVGVKYAVFLVVLIYFYYFLGSGFLLLKEKDSNSVRIIKDVFYVFNILKYIKPIIFALYLMCLVLSQLIELSVVNTNTINSSLYELINYNKYAVVILLAIDRTILTFKKRKEELKTEVKVNYEI